MRAQSDQSPTKRWTSLNRWTLGLIAALGLSFACRFALGPPTSMMAAACVGGFLIVLAVALIVGAIACAIARKSLWVFNIATGTVIILGLVLLWYFNIRVWTLGLR